MVFTATHSQGGGDYEKNHSLLNPINVHHDDLHNCNGFHGYR
jgi:hypothetical protein